MKVFKKIVVSLVMAMSMAAISSTAFAAEKKDPNAVVREAAEGTIAKIEEAISLIDKNGEQRRHYQQLLLKHANYKKSFVMN